MGMQTDAPWPARLLLLAAAVLAPLAIALTAAEGAGVVAWIDAVGGVAYLGVGLLGLLMASQQPRNVAAWVLLIAALSAPILSITDTLALRTSGGSAVATGVLHSFAAAGLFGLFTLGVLLFPDGRGHGRLGRVLVPVAVIALTLLVLGASGSAIAPSGVPLLGEAVASIATGLVLLGFAIVLPLTVLAAVTATARRRHALGVERQGLRLLEFSAWTNAIAFIVCALLSALSGLPAWFGAIADQTGLVFAVAAWVAIVRFRLVELRVVLARTLPYLVASVLVFGIAALIATLLGTLAARWFGVAAGSVVAALVALLLREQLQTLANLIVYGHRVDPATERTRRLEQALRDSRELLIAARDNERRRIRRDLHDDLGPTLAGLVLGVEHVERHLDDSDRARAELSRLHEAGQAAVEDVRRIVYALRPPVLDSLGLAGAIREQAALLGAESVDIEDLPELTEALEIGVYLIAFEAMKNAATHARPGAFRVRLNAAERLRLEIHDDGPGLPACYTPGIGIGSMRERAAELGGTLEIRALRPTGTLVLAEWVLSA